MRSLFSVVLLLAAGAAVAQEPNFGRAVALTQNELVVGQPVNWYGPGMVYTYRFEGGQWREQARLAASDSARMDDFGRALAIDGNTMVVGAPRKREGAGVAYVFSRGNSGWTQAGVIEAPAGSREFAGALSLTGDELLVGASDGVHAYRRAGATWTHAGTLSGGTGFGYAFDREGEWLIAGAPAADSGRGKVFVARRSGGEWTPPAEVMLPPQSNQRANIGVTVEIAGDRAYVGAPGAAVVYVLARGADGTWTHAGELKPAGDARGSQFGRSIAVVGDEVWVGAPGTNDGNGAVHRFVRSGGAAVQLAADSADGTHWPFAFGYAIAAQGNRAVVSMPQRDFGEGRVLALTRAGSQWRAGQLLEGQIFRIGQGVQPGQKCENGKIGEFTCANIEVVAHMQVDDLGGERGAWVNDVWGWTDPQTRRDYALVARRDGVSVVDVTNPSAPQLIGNLPRTQGSPPSVWRDIKVLNNHAFIVADGAGEHGMQVFDLTRIRNATSAPARFTPDTTYHAIHSAHNVVADTASGFVYVVGANGGGETCGGGLHMVDVRNPKQPKFAGCYNDRVGANPRGYTHDAQCVTYGGPDERYRGRQICVGSNEKEINIADVTDKANPVTVGRNSYPNVAYAHQGWFDDEQRFFYMNDELDELAGNVEGTRTIVWDLSRLDDPIVANMYHGPVNASDHNLFVKGNRVYESNYGSGLRVLDITDRKNPREVGFIDSAPYNKDEPGHSSTQSGAWSNYPFFQSGVVIFTSVREGLFIVRVTPQRPIS